MDRQEIRNRCQDVLLNEYGLTEIVQWFPRTFLQGYTDALVRVIPYPASVYLRIFDGGDIEEITFAKAKHYDPTGSTIGGYDV